MLSAIEVTYIVECYLSPDRVAKSCSCSLKNDYVFDDCLGQTDCRETSFTDRNGVLVSPNFPLSYPININCTYAIDVGRNNSVQLKFKYFELQAPRSMGYCANDWLTVSALIIDHLSSIFIFRPSSFPFIEPIKHKMNVINTLYATQAAQVDPGRTIAHLRIKFSSSSHC